MEKETMLGKILVKIAGFPLAMLRVLYDLVEKLAGEASQEWLAELKKFLRKEKCCTDVVAEVFLKLISGDETIVLDAVDGKEVLANAKDIFAYIDSNFNNWGAEKPGQPTGKTPVKIYEMAKDANFSQMFGSLSADARKLCLTQAQIKGFVKKYRNWLRADGYATFFLFESNGQFFVADVDVCSVGLYVLVHEFEDGHVWNADYRHRVVVPQLALTA